MATIGREAETTIWLHNKLGSNDDLWLGSAICSQLSKEKLQSIIECFHCLQSHVKVKLLLSFIHLPKRNIEEWKEELNELCGMGLHDGDPWVSMVSDILSTYPLTGQFNSNLNDVHQITHDIINDLRKIVRKSQDAGMLPLECLYLSRNAVVAITGTQLQPIKHFTLKRKPRSAMLRAEVLQKSLDAANQLKRNVGSVPVKMRSFAKKMDDSTPLKGIPKQVLGSGGFLSKNNSLLGSNRNQHHNPSKEGGIKFLDINEQPICAKEAKKKKVPTATLR